MPRKPGKHALAFIFVTILIDTIGLGIIIPVMPKLIMELTGDGLADAALYGGWLMFLYAALQFVMAPVIGNLSDRFGRRPVLLFALAALSLDYMILALAPTIVWLFIGRAGAGIAGASYTTANAYIADVTPPEKRAQSFGLVGAAFGIGFIVGPAMGGLLGEYGARLPFYAAAGLALINVAYGFFVLPETLSKDKRRPFSLKRANPVGAIKQMWRYPLVIGLIGALLLHQIAHDANPSVWTYYTIEKFAWTPFDIGLSMAFVGLMVAVVQGGLIRLVIPRIGEENAIYLGFILGGMGFLGFAFATEGWMIFAWIVPWSLMGLATPALRSIMSRQVPADAQGELQGTITSVMSLTMVASPLLMTQLFHAFAGAGASIYFPGAPFFLAGIMVTGSAVVSMWAIRTAQRQKAQNPPD